MLSIQPYMFAALGAALFSAASFLITYFVVIAFLALGLTALFFLSFKMGSNITIPNILLSSRGVLVVLATFVLAHVAGNLILESQSRHTYAFRFLGAVLMSLAVALVVEVS